MLRHTMLRHTIATLAYRGGKAIRGAPPGFGEFRVAAASRTPVEILAHIGDLLDWGLSLAEGERTWHYSAPLPWDAEVARFFAALNRLDMRLASGKELGATAESLFQAPIADALTHIGQIGMLRRLAGSPVRGESYLRADIAIGRVGPEQSPPGLEFD